MARPLIFLSHSVRDAAVVKDLRDWIDRALLSGVEFFQSSDDVSLRPGTAWFRDIVDALSRCEIILVVVTPDMLRSTWAFFEAGGGHLRGIQVVPVCGFGVAIDSLPSPLNELTAVDVSSSAGQHRLLALLADAADLRLTKRTPKLRIEPEPPLAMLGELNNDPGFLGVASHQRAMQMFHENLRDMMPTTREVLLSGASLTDIVHLRTNALSDAAKSAALQRMSIVIKSPDGWWSEVTHRGMGFKQPYDASDSNAMLIQARRDLLVLGKQTNGSKARVELLESTWPPTYAAACLVAPTRTFAFFEPLLFGHPLADRICSIFAERTSGTSPFIAAMRAAHDRLADEADEAGVVEP